MLLPVSQMMARLDKAKGLNEAEHFHDLLHAGELLVKLCVALLAAASDENTDRHLYRTEWQLVRADSLGKWIDAGRDLLVGPQASLLNTAIRPALDSMVTPTAQPVWHRRATESLHRALAALYPAVDRLPKQTSFIHWLLLMGELRNKTKGHGAPLPETRAVAIPDLEQAIQVVAQECPALHWPVLFAEQEMSGQWRVSPISTNASSIPGTGGLKAGGETGLYLALHGLRPIRLLFTTRQLDDFWLPNGNYKEKKDGPSFEVISYCSGDIDFRSGEQYRGVPAALPSSTTAASGDLQPHGHIFSNAPSQIVGYIHRPVLEDELSTVLGSEHRHPIVTLVGRGGIGKTSLALDAIDRVAQGSRFFLVVWFSSRDIDLLDHGPKQVSPDVLTFDDVVRVYKRMIGDTSKMPAADVLARDLADASRGPTLFIFDNFETVRSPEDLFRFVDERVRLPNKVLITTRHRAFKGDYPIEVGGMERAECLALIDDQARRLGIDKLLSDSYKNDLVAESEGHPYVIKILLGEVAKEGKARKVDRIVASRDEILDALFDRTFRSLSESARRVFLTLSAWRSAVPIAAVEAVLLRNPDERIAVQEAVEELERFSFVEVVESDTDKHLFVTVPLAAALFGQRRLAVSPDRAAVDADVQLLREFGAAQRTDVHHGIGPRVLKMFKHVAAEIQANRTRLADVEPMLQFLARKWSPAWLLLATLRSEASRDGDTEGQKQALRSYLEVVKGLEAVEAWKRLGVLCKHTGDLLGEVQAWAEMSAIPDLPLEEVSRAVNRVNGILRDNKDLAPSDERLILLKRFVDVMARRISEASADDLSRLAWLYLQLHDDKRAYEVAELGLKREPDNEHCRKLVDRILEQSGRG